MPKAISPHVALRTDFRETVNAAYALNFRLEAVIAIKSRGSSEVFHGKVDHSQPPWNASSANLILELHAWVRDTERLWRYLIGLEARERGGSGDNTRVALKTLLGQAEAVSDDTVLTARKWLDSWVRRARITLGDEEAIKRLPRAKGDKEPRCPWCKRATLRQKAVEGVVFCIDPKCKDELDRRPAAWLEYFRGEMVLRWQDGVIGAP